MLVMLMKAFAIVLVRLELMLTPQPKPAKCVNLLVFSVLYCHHIAQDVFLIYMPIKVNAHQRVQQERMRLEMNAKYVCFPALIAQTNLPVRNALEVTCCTCKLHALIMYRNALMISIKWTLKNVFL